MSPKSLREKLSAPRPLLGLCNSFPAAGIIESMCPGWDLLWIDGQHGQMSYDSILAALRTAAACNLETLLRVPGQDPTLIGLYADTAPSALMIPMVNTPEQAQAVVAAACLAPRGTRSYGARRAIDLFGRNYFQSQNPLVVAQIETAEGVDNAHAIAAIDGIDMLFFGPDDLKMSLQIPIDTPVSDHPQLIAALEKTAAAAHAHKKFVATVAGIPPVVQLALHHRYHLLIAGGDSGFLRSAATEKLKSLHNLPPLKL